MKFARYANRFASATQTNCQIALPELNISSLNSINIVLHLPQILQYAKHLSAQRFIATYPIQKVQNSTCWLSSTWSRVRNTKNNPKFHSTFFFRLDSTMTSEISFPSLTFRHYCDLRSCSRELDSPDTVEGINEKWSEATIELYSKKKRL